MGGDGLIEPPHLAQGDAQAVQRCGFGVPVAELGEDGKGLPEGGDGLVEPPHLAQGDAQVVQRRGFALLVTGVVRGVDGCLPGRDDVVEVATPVQEDGQVRGQGDCCTCTAGGGGEGDGGDEGGPFGVQPGQGVGAAAEAFRDGLAGQGAQVVVGGVGGVPVVSSSRSRAASDWSSRAASRASSVAYRRIRSCIRHRLPPTGCSVTGWPRRARQEGADLSGRGVGQRGGGLGGGIRARVKRQQPKQPRLLGARRR